jgi:hypothetical protein
VENDDSPAGRPAFGNAVFSITQVALNLGLAIGVLAALYLLYGAIFGGVAGVDSLPKADHNRVIGNVHSASQVMMLGFAVASLCSAFLFFYEELVGYVLVIVSALVAFGIPFGFEQFGGDRSGTGIATTLGAFPPAALVPGAVGALLVLKDIVSRFVRALQNKAVDPAQMKYGASARAEKPLRTSLLAKCWEGPFCREAIRPNCPIFIAKATCWKQRRGCFCEEEIISAAAGRVNGLVLEMAPTSQYNFANPGPSASTSVGFSGVGGGTAPSITDVVSGPPRKVPLSDAQKIERCRNCVIYNEHQRDKYRILLPVVLVGMVGLCYLLSGWTRIQLGFVLGNLEGLFHRLSFGNGSSAKINLDSSAEWALVIAFSVIVISKSLQVLEWAIFEKKI